MNKINKEEVDIVVGLIDSMIIVSKVLQPMLEKLCKDELPESVIEALRDLTTNKSSLYILRAVYSDYIISEEKASVFNSIIEGLKYSDIKITK